MDKGGTCLLAELDTLFHTTNVNILDVGSFREVFYTCSTVEYLGGILQAFVDRINVLSNISTNYKQSVAKQFTIRIVKVIEEHCLQTVLCCLVILSTNHTIDLLSRRLDEFVQNMDSQIACRTSEEYILQYLLLSCKEGIQTVHLQQLVDSSIVVVLNCTLGHISILFRCSYKFA